ncbi:TonB-dependent receptor [Mangrovibacterium marinum]|uniref:Iron complex outermembrane receptor protein n=1 Tax=Mangrovibacterium marinum TaxID=1639118 RepID=A0A2T5C2A5_9BACT|nr:TonB-dependent receptor [Mangrovibacterium marinum]PTN08815.1 iron complex outermembrane receptor protein [Mangrovibacterium marinum]
MKHSILTVLAVLFLLLRNTVALPIENTGKTSLSGSVLDAETREPLPAVTIYFPEIKTGTLTDEQGNFQLHNLPQARLTVQLSLIGYESISKMLDLKTINSVSFELSEAITEISEVVITGQPGLIEQKRTASPISVVPKTELLQNTSTNIIDALAKQPGVSQITTGAGISKPVIRGLGYNRVIVINNGIRQEGQQWGDEHGVEIDEYGVNHVEILKGPASLAFGSDAMAGVINLISAPTVPEGNIRGAVMTNYQTNNGLFGYSANAAGNNEGFIWDARISGKRAHDYQNNIDNWVENSAFRENAASLLVGLNQSWGYSHLTLSLYNLEPGIVGEGHHHHDGETAEEHEQERKPKSYQPEAPFQKINHYKMAWNSKLFVGQGNLQTTLGFQQNNRKEFESADAYGLYFKLNTLSYDLKYTLPTANNWTLTGGMGGMWQQSKNEGSEFLVPAYQLFDAGIFAIAHKQINRLDLSGGLRFDRRHIDSDPLYLDASDEPTMENTAGATARFSAFDSSFTGFSASLGASYQLSSSVYTKLNISRGFRAPNIAELGSNGAHEGTSRYEIGNTALKPENSLQFDWGIGLDSKHVSAELNLFHNHVNHYIYSHKLQNVAETDSLINEVPVFKFTGGDANLYGGEFFIDIHPHPLDFLHFQNTFSYTRGKLVNQTTEATNLPLIPPARWISEIKVDFKKINRWLQNSWLNFGLEHNWKQDRYYAAYNTETATAAYTLLNAGVGTDIVGKHRKWASLYISCRNLTDKAYQSHLSRLKYTGHNDETGREGYFNRGRNFSVKLIVPFGTKL